MAITMERSVKHKITSFKDLKRKNKDLAIRPISDALFKTSLQELRSKGVLVTIISEVLMIHPTYVKENLSFLNTELTKENYADRGKITDLLISIKDNVINLEANSDNKIGARIKNNGYHHRLSYSAYHMGEKVKMKYVYQINFNLKNRFDDRLIIRFVFKDDENKFIDSNNFQRFYINMEKAIKKYYNKEELSKLEKILVIMQLESIKEMRAIAKGDEDLMSYVDVIEEFSEDGTIIGLYDKEREDALINAYNNEESRQQGLEQGEHTKAIDIAKKMLKANVSITDIIKFTGLSKKEINALKS